MLRVILFDAILHDIRSGFRAIYKSPGFTAVVVITLALGIGATSAVFSGINALLIRPIPYYEEPDQLVQIWSTQLKNGQTSRFKIRTTDFTEIRKLDHSFAQVGISTSSWGNFTGNGDPENLTGALISSNMFSLIGVRPVLGRNFFAEEEEPGKDQVVILSHQIWYRRFAGASNVLGQAITLDNKKFTIIGVMPAGFSFPGRHTDYWLPFSMAQEIKIKGGGDKDVIARLKPGVTIKDAQREVNFLSSQLRGQPGYSSNFLIISLRDQLVGDKRPALLLLFSATALVLLIACTNVASLYLARNTSRRKEFGIRVALGASRATLVRQLLIESLLTALLGGGLGLLLAWLGISLIRSSRVGILSGLDKIEIDQLVLLFALFSSILTGILFGLLPALRFSRPDLLSSLKEGLTSTRSTFRSIDSARLSNFLIGFEIALASVLLVGSLLLVRSLYLLTRVELGFDSQNILTTWISLPGTQTMQQRAFFFKEVLDRLERLPGIQAVGMTYHSFFGGRMTTFIESHDRDQIDQSSSIEVEFRIVSPDFFRALGLRILKGREFSGYDIETAPKVAIIDEALARRIFTNDDPLGKEITIEADNGKGNRQVVGVVSFVRDVSLDNEPSPTIYVPYMQVSRPSMTLMIRTDGNPLNYSSAVQHQVWEVDKNVPVDPPRLFEDQIATELAQPRFQTHFFGGFTILAFLLAMAGIYGIISFHISQRTIEMGIRIALGASPGRVLRMMIWQGMIPTVIGLAFGLLSAIWLSHFLSGMLYGIRPLDPATYVGASILLAGCSLLAIYLPTRRVMHIDPSQALRWE